MFFLEFYLNWTKFYDQNLNEYQRIILVFINCINFCSQKTKPSTNYINIIYTHIRMYIYYFLRGT